MDERPTARVDVKDVDAVLGEVIGNIAGASVARMNGRVASPRASMIRGARMRMVGVVAGWGAKKVGEVKGVVAFVHPRTGLLARDYAQLGHMVGDVSVDAISITREGDCVIDVLGIIPSWRLYGCQPASEDSGQ